jgi:hypothetical protein
MTKDQINKWAKQAGYDMEAGQRIGESSDIELFTRFASLVAAKAAAEEREECAKVCDAFSEKMFGGAIGAQKCAKAIRQRGAE